MRRRHVVVLFQHHLFGEAVARALAAADPQIEVSTLSVGAVSSEQLIEMAPDAIVLEDRPALDAKTCLLDAAPALTFVVGPEANTAEVFERHEIIQATANDIVARILKDVPHRPRPHAPAAHSP